MFKNKRQLIKGCNTCTLTNINNDNRSNNVLHILKRQFLLPRKLKRYRNRVVLKENEYAGTT